MTKDERYTMIRRIEQARSTETRLLSQQGNSSTREMTAVFLWWASFVIFGYALLSY